MSFILKNLVKHFEYFHECLSRSISPRDFSRKLLLLSRIRHRKKNLIIKTIIDFESNFINKIMIFLLKDFIKYFEYFHEYLMKSISPQDFSRKLL